MRSPSILVTGAGGFACRNVIDRLLRAGYSVVAVDRAFDLDLRQHWSKMWDGQIHLLENDLADVPDFSVDYLLHGAAITATPTEANLTPEYYFRAHIEPVLAMLEWAERNQVQRAIFVSSDAVFRPMAVGAVTENTLPHPEGLYSVAKRTTESLIETMHTVYERDVLTVRLGSIYGPGELRRDSRPRISRVMQMVEMAVQRGTIEVNEPEYTDCWTYAPDLGNAINALLNMTGKPQPLYNLSSEQVLTNADIAKIIRKHLPTTEILSGTTDTPELQMTGYLSSRRLDEDTGFNKWTNFKEGVGQVIEWYQFVNPEAPFAERLSSSSPRSQSNQLRGHGQGVSA